MNALRFAPFFVLGTALVLGMENDFTRFSQLFEMFPIDYLFLAVWGSLFGIVLWAVWTGLSRAGRTLLRLKTAGS